MTNFDPAATPLLRADALSKRVPNGASELTILDQVSFTVAAGESLAVVGASGSGKTTLLGLLAGLDEPSEGDVIFKGQSLLALSEEGRTALRRDAIGFVFQSFHLMPTLSALENVMLPLEIKRMANPEQIAKSWLDKVGLGARMNHSPRKLSGGEQQRVAIARAFAASPALVFADEPTGNLDEATGQKVADLMFSLNAELGVTLILVTHDAKLAARCGRQIRLLNGRQV